MTRIFPVTAAVLCFSVVSPGHALDDRFVDALEQCVLSIVKDDPGRFCGGAQCDVVARVTKALRTVEDLAPAEARFAEERDLAPEGCRIALDVAQGGALTGHAERTLAIAVAYSDAARTGSRQHRERIALTRAAGYWATAASHLPFDLVPASGSPSPADFAWRAFLLWSWDDHYTQERFYPYWVFGEEMAWETRAVLPAAGYLAWPAEAEALLEKLYLYGHPGALHVVGMIHRHHGRLAEAEYDLRRAAKLGRTAAYFELGLLRTRDYHLTRTWFVNWEYDRQTFDWMMQAAERGHPGAALFIARAVCVLPAAKPDFVPTDPAMVARLLDVAVSAGLAEARTVQQAIEAEGGVERCGQP